MRKSLTMLLLILALGGGLAAAAVGVGVIQEPQAPPREPAVPDETGSVKPPISSNSGEQAPSVDYLPCTAPEQTLAFPNYWAGRSFDRLTVSAVIRRCVPPKVGRAMRANFVSYVYGDCDASRGEACAPPIEVQSWSSGERNKASITSFSILGAPFPQGTDTDAFGLPARRYEDGKRLEIYYPESTVVIYGDDPGRIDRFGAALVEGPAVLTELVAFGLEFDGGCVANSNYCVATMRSK